MPSIGANSESMAFWRISWKPTALEPDVSQGRLLAGLAAAEAAALHEVIGPTLDLSALPFVCRRIGWLGRSQQGFSRLQLAAVQSCADIAKCAKLIETMRDWRSPSIHFPSGVRVQRRPTC